MKIRNKKIIIALIIILLAFIIALTIIIIKNNKSNIDETATTEERFYVSNTEENTGEYISPNKKEEIIINDYENSFTYTIVDVTGNESQIMCLNVKKLTPEQNANKEDLVENVISYSKSCQKSIDQINILDSSNDEQIYVTATYVNDESEELVILYDKYKTHSFTRCVNKEEYDMIQAGGCAG